MTAKVTYKTLETTLNPDGRLELALTELPERPVRLMVTILDDGEDGLLSELGDYHDRLSDYEDRLERGEIQWQSC
ncbi:MAG TPA: hypothetical protein VND64_24575 [Pirellulales bacterium]|nr:hypothetical protein [Pirellulales bacterium]